jgi:hypothetical protein
LKADAALSPHPAVRRRIQTGSALTRSAALHPDDVPQLDPVARCWRERFGDLADDVDARVAGATSLYLL